MSRIVNPAKSLPRTPIRGRNPEGWGEGVVAVGLSPSNSAARHQFESLLLPYPGHGHALLMTDAKGHHVRRGVGDGARAMYNPPTSQ